jgi:UDP-3-O-[3-hydroxymyristoyl] N-acetylglucosamine deacetylase
VTEVVVTGVGVHSGARARVVLRERPGPVTLIACGVEARIDELGVASTARATTVQAHEGRLRVGTVEHLFAALAGLGVRAGVAIEVEGPELPLLDGGARAWCEAIDGLSVRAEPPRVRVARAATVRVGASVYELAPGDRVEVEARLELDGYASIAPEARWNGSAEDFRARIAPARTFALAEDIERLAEARLARHVDPTAVLVLTPAAIHWAGTPPEPDEPARHKLLDLVGDLYLHGGPPLGRVRAIRPGHGANAAAMAQACAEGVLLPMT